MHQYGCRVVQKIFDFCNEKEKMNLFQEINKNFIDFCQDQFGNYVIQHILDKIGGKNLPQIYQALKGRIYEMSIHKFASNVIEKCLYNGTEEQKTEMINELLNKEDNVHDSLISLVKDKFGNYVVQKIIEYAPEKSRILMVERIMNNPELRKKKDTYAKHVINYIEKKGYYFNNNNINQNNQYMNNNNLMQNIQGNLDIINNMNNLGLDFEDQDNFGHN